MNRNLCACILSLICLPFVSFSQFAEYSNEFLNIGAGARGMAMGAAQVASVSDATAGYWNPAGLVAVKDKPEASLMHAEYFAGIGKYDFGALAIPVADNKRTLGLTFLRFAVDDIPNTLSLIGPGGTINYDNVQSFSSADYALLFSFAQNIKETGSKKMSFGFNVKIIHRVVGTFASAWGFGLDAGFQMHSNNWRVGVVAKDFTSTFNAWAFSFTDVEKQELYLANNDIPVRSTELTAPSLVLGGGYNFKLSSSVNLLTEMGANVTFDGKRNTVISTKAFSIDPHLGLEASLNNKFFVRAGITNFQQALDDADTLNQKKVWIYQPSLGAGVQIGQVKLDYAYSNLANQSNPLYTNVFSLRFYLPGKRKN
jgi:hypothetical protein